VAKMVSNLVLMTLILTNPNLYEKVYHIFICSFVCARILL
jgi:hypothetical protein